MSYSRKPVSTSVRNAAVNSGNIGKRDGRNWLNKLSFIPNAEKPNDSPELVNPENLMSYFDMVAGSKDSIQTVSNFKENLSNVIPRSGVFYHEFIVVKSDNWYWSIEKFDYGIAVQRSKEIKYVQEMFHIEERQNRSHVTTVSLSGNQKQIVLQIFQWILNEDYINRKYHLTMSNCQHFAKHLLRTISFEMDTLLCISIEGKGLPELSVSTNTYWQTGIDFTPDANKIGKYPIEVIEEDILDYFASFPESAEAIMTVCLYSQKSSEWRPKWLSTLHKFVIVQTTNWCWSFEYFPESKGGIAVQRAKDSNILEKQYRDDIRAAVTKFKDELDAAPTVLQVFRWIKLKKYVTGDHKSKNHVFAELLFDSFTEKIVQLDRFASMPLADDGMCANSPSK